MLVFILVFFSIPLHFLCHILFYIAFYCVLSYILQMTYIHLPSFIFFLYPVFYDVFSISCPFFRLLFHVLCLTQYFFNFSFKVDPRINLSPKFPLSDLNDSSIDMQTSNEFKWNVFHIFSRVCHVREKGGSRMSRMASTSSRSNSRSDIYVKKTPVHTCMCIKITLVRTHMYKRYSSINRKHYNYES